MSDTHATADETSETSADKTARSAGTGARQFIDSGRQALEITFGVHKAMLDEMAKASDDFMERMRTEIEVASEFVARLASAHSVKDIASACNDCGQHQADAFRQESQKLFQQSQRLCERASRLLSPAQQAAS
jgi:hypothetical protein